MCMRYIIFLSVACLTLPHFSTSSLTRHDFPKKVLCVWIASTNFPLSFQRVLFKPMASYGLNKFNSNSERSVILPTPYHSQPRRLCDVTSSYTVGIGQTFPGSNLLKHEAITLSVPKAYTNRVLLAFRLASYFIAGTNLT